MKVIELWRVVGSSRQLVYGKGDINVTIRPLRTIRLTPATSGILTFSTSYGRVQVFEGDDIELCSDGEILWTGYIERFTNIYGAYRFAVCQPTRNTFHDVLMQGNTLALYGQVHVFEDGSIPVRKLDIDIGTFNECWYTCIQYEPIQKWKLRKDDRVCGGG